MSTCFLDSEPTPDGEVEGDKSLFSSERLHFLNDNRLNVTKYYDLIQLQRVSIEVFQKYSPMLLLRMTSEHFLTNDYIFLFRVLNVITVENLLTFYPNLKTTEY